MMIGQRCCSSAKCCNDIVVVALLFATWILFGSCIGTIHAFSIRRTATTTQQQQHRRQGLSGRTTTATTTTTSLYYEPKWKRKETLAEQLGPVSDLKQVGLIGTIPVVFQQGDEIKRTMAIPGQPLREVAIQAGQFIKYGCGKGECGTCEALVNGQWIRPCSVNVPSDLLPGMEYTVQVKKVKNKASSSGKFYSVRSFLYGFYNNVLGMIGMVTYRRNAKRNYQERMEYENLIRQKALERKLAKTQAQAQAQTQSGGSAGK